MARNEEKQLARLNRYYLEKQKQEELKKRPPRPRLDTLNTSRDLRKWLPTITRDIDFYVKQMEVTCYTDSKIEEFNSRIERLRQEYRAYLHKLRKLDPDVSLTSWSDRPYTNRKRCSDTIAQGSGDAENGSEEPKEKTQALSDSVGKFVPIIAPVLHNMPRTVGMYGLEKPAPIIWNANPETEDQPLQFNPGKTLSICNGSTSPSKEQPFQNSSAAYDCIHGPSSSDRGVSHSVIADPQPPQYCKSDVSFCRKCCDRLTDKGVISGAASSFHEDKTESEACVCSCKNKRLDDVCLDGTKSASGTSEVQVSAVSDFPGNQTDSKVTSGLQSVSAMVIKPSASKGTSSFNLLNLDYSDSSDEDLR